MHARQTATAGIAPDRAARALRCIENAGVSPEKRVTVKIISPAELIAAVHLILGKCRWKNRTTPEAKARVTDEIKTEACTLDEKVNV